MSLGIARPLLQNYILKIQKLGYDIKCEILNAKYFETATSRQRLFILGFRKDLKIKPVLPKPFCKPVSFNEATKDIVISKKENQELKDQIKGFVKLRNFLKYIKEGETVAKIHPKGSYFNIQKINRAKPLPTITTLVIALIHPIELRPLAISELKACSSFPQDFKLIGTYEQQYERIGRAVPPNLMKNMALSIKKLLLS